MPIGIIATLKIQPEKAKDAEAAFNELAEAVNKNEPECLFYSFFKASEGEYVVLESYKDEAALAAHSQTAHFKAAGPKMAGFLAGAPDIKKMDGI